MPRGAGMRESGVRDGDQEKAMEGYFDRILVRINCRIFGPVTVYSDFPSSQAIWLKSLKLAAG